MGGWGKAERDGSWRWGCAGSSGPGDDELGGVGEEPGCSAWLMRETKLQPFLPFLLSILHLILTPVLYLCFCSISSYFAEVKSLLLYSVSATYVFPACCMGLILLLLFVHALLF